MKRARCAAEADPAESWRLVFFEQDLLLRAQSAATRALEKAARRRVRALDGRAQMDANLAKCLLPNYVERMFHYWRGQRPDPPHLNPAIRKEFTPPETAQIEPAILAEVERYASDLRERAAEMIQLAQVADQSVQVVREPESAHDVLAAMS